MTVLGTIALWLSILFALWSVLLGTLGARWRKPELTASARRAALLQILLYMTIMLALVTAFVRQDFNVAYVANHSSRSLDATSLVVAVASGWSGFALLVLLAVSLLAAPRLSSHVEIRYFAVMVLLVSLAVLFGDNPFSRLGTTPIEGRGLDPRVRVGAATVEVLLFVAGVAAALTALLRFASSRALAGWRLILSAWLLLTGGLALGAWRTYLLADARGALRWSPMLLAAAFAWAVVALAITGRVLANWRRGRRILPGATLTLAGGLLVVTGLAFARSTAAREIRLKPGATATVPSRLGGSYQLLHMGLSRFQSPDHVTAAATLDVDRNGKSLGLLTAERRQYFDLLGQPTGDPLVRVGLHRGLFEDVQIGFRESTRDEEVLYQVRLRPLMSLVWFGLAILLAGGCLLAAGEWT